MLASFPPVDFLSTITTENYWYVYFVFHWLEPDFKFLKVVSRKVWRNSMLLESWSTNFVSSFATNRKQCLMIVRYSRYSFKISLPSEFTAVIPRLFIDGELWYEITNLILCGAYLASGWAVVRFTKPPIFPTILLLWGNSSEILVILTWHIELWHLIVLIRQNANLKIDTNASCRLQRLIMPLSFQLLKCGSLCGNMSLKMCGVLYKLEAKE